MNNRYDHIIIGSGIIGLSVARALRKTGPLTRILIIDKEKDAAYHASGRNSGVLHAGFYYTADSMKAQLTVRGNQAMKEYCRGKALSVNECGKLVVAQNEEELTQLYELEKRGKANGSTVSIIDEEKAAEIEPNVRTFKKALYSPTTASIDPVSVCQSLKKDLLSAEVTFSFETKYLGRDNDTVKTTKGDFSAAKIINCAGLYADKVAHDFGFGKNYTMIPFKGLYLKYTKNKTDVRTNIYPVPNLKNPFLGVHFTKMVDGSIKIGPTATPAFWRENYGAFLNFEPDEFLSVASYELRMFLSNAAGFRDLAFDEIRKYNRKYFVGLACRMVKTIDPKGFTEFTLPGIRAQLLDKRSLNLVQDFVIEGDQKSTHVLNAISPAFTCAFPFAEHVVQNFILA